MDEVEIYDFSPPERASQRARHGPAAGEIYEGQNEDRRLASYRLPEPTEVALSMASRS